MKKILVFLAVASLALAAPALSQQGGGMGMGGGMGPRLYNPQTVTTVTGTVEKLQELSMGPGGGMGMKFCELLLKTDKGTLLIHMGPIWYLDQQKFAVKAGDKLEVTGSQVTLNNQPALIAKEVKLNDKSLKLRDDQGIPAWRGKGRGMGPGGGQGKGPAGM